MKLCTEDKMAIIDGTDIMIIGGYGNVSGNLNLLKYSNNEIEEMIKENNIEKDNIRLIQSLLKTIKWQKHQLEEKDKIFDEIIDSTFYTCCPYEIFYDEEEKECNKVKKICDCDNCKDDYKKCWLKYFENKIEE